MIVCGSEHTHEIKQRSKRATEQHRTTIPVEPSVLIDGATALVRVVHVPINMSRDHAWVETCARSIEKTCDKLCRFWVIQVVISPFARQSWIMIAHTLAGMAR